MIRTWDEWCGHLPAGCSELSAPGAHQEHNGYPVWHLQENILKPTHFYARERLILGICLWRIQNSMIIFSMNYENISILSMNYENILIFSMNYENISIFSMNYENILTFSMNYENISISSMNYENIYPASPLPGWFPAPKNIPGSYLAHVQQH